MDILVLSTFNIDKSKNSASFENRWEDEHAVTEAMSGELTEHRKGKQQNWKVNDDVEHYNLLWVKCSLFHLLCLKQKQKF